MRPPRSSDSGTAGLSWERGRQGGASHLYIHHGSRAYDGLAGRNDDQGRGLEPRSVPTLSRRQEACASALVFVGIAIGIGGLPDDRPPLRSHPRSM
ncbi:MAG: hypothetical protein OXN97_12085 [Bryobacterales bacterium]|nr:hypothetical protein [Bryobacterales bacterium]